MKRRVFTIVLCLILLMSTLIPSAMAATNEFEYTDNIAQNMVNAALAQQGKKNADFDGMPRDNWCAYFIDWLSMVSGAGNAGLLPNKYSGYGTTRTVAQYTVKRGTGDLTCFLDTAYNTMHGYVGDSAHLLKGSSSSFTPKAGDLIFFIWNGSTAKFASHVGLVYKVTSSKVYYVDGNGSATDGDGAFYTRSYVNTHSISRTSGEISAYLRPNYGGGTVVVPSGVTIAGSNVSSLTKTSVRLNGSCSYTGTRPSSVGVYFGTSKTNMTVKDSDTINHTKNPFDIWYDISGLKAGTTYYWQLYAVVDGQTIKESTIHSFTTLGDSTAVSVVSTTDCCYYVTIPANYKVQGYETPTSTTNYRYIAAKDSSYYLSCKQKVVLSDGNVRYRYTDSSGYTIYFVYTSAMDLTVVHNYTFTGVEATHPHATYDRCTCGYVFKHTDSNYVNSCIICNPPVISVTGVSLDPTSVTLNAGDSATLTAEVAPENATNDAVSWSSSDASVASVSDGGKVLAHKPGTAIITVRTDDGGKTATCTVTVRDAFRVTFSDVPADAWFAKAVDWAVEENVTSGTSDTTFSPDAPCTRAQAVSFLWRAAGKPEPASASGFSDVPRDAYYAKAVAWAVENGITAGTSTTTFSPDDTCTRAQIVSFLWRFAGKPAAGGAANPFLDVWADSYYYHAVLWAVENEITAGTSPTTFSPEDPCTRAQIVSFLHRHLGQ